MASLTNEEVGAIVYGMIPGITAGVSGIMTDLVNQQVYFAEQITGESLSVSAISEPYQPGVTSLTAAAVMEVMESQGIGTKSVSIGELKIAKGMQEGTSKSLRDDGIMKLKAIGERISSYQTYI